ncbi:MULTISPECIES: hypothetical protein [Leisingera]|uniref:hypothetical protein n=1 Tax=Leisingera TaxID=191028 RepID=UPI0011628A96|nr:hypothetical protein [Leisingera sp. UBA4491]QDI76750.1 hypothetical protein R2C4_13690 [Leisingera aquaemixtae]
MLQATGFKNFCDGSSSLPEPSHFDACHARWRQQVIDSAEIAGLTGFSHGRAAKLINVFLKSIYLTDFQRPVEGVHQELSKVDAIHPPIDRVLLSALETCGSPGLQIALRTCGKCSWTKMGSDTYQHLIDAIREETAGRLWTIEAYWQGYQ